LEELNKPAQRCSTEELIVRKFAAEKKLSGIDHGQSTIALSSKGVVVEGLYQTGYDQSIEAVKQPLWKIYLFEPLQCLLGQLVLLAMLFQVFHQFGEDRLEFLQCRGHFDGRMRGIERCKSALREVSSVGSAMCEEKGTGLQSTETATQA
jgi:hypothetical protein